MKRLFLIAAAALAASTLYALPGTDRVIEDISGEYVYYRDESFETASVVGFAYYDDTTYAARYYSGADAKQKTAEKDITLYVTVDAENTSGFELTGERMEGVTEEGDTDIVNYLHSLLYELSARRQKASLSAAAETVSAEEDFPLFGGDVTITYSDLIPVFNIERISDSKGKDVFYVECLGRLSDSNDTAFSTYKGYDGIPKDKSRSFKRARAGAVNVAYEGQSVTLDEGWTQSMDNLWFLGDGAMLSMASVSVPEGTKSAMQTLARRYSEGVTTYALYRHRTDEQESAARRLMNVFVDEAEDGVNVTRDFKVLTELPDGSIDVLTLTVFDSVYKKNRSYFRKILESYSAE